MKDDEIDAILRENRLRRAPARTRKAPPEPAEAQTPLAALQKKLGVTPPKPDDDDDLALVLAVSDAGPPREVLVSRRRRKIVGEHG
jgi:hypothetical protein